MKEMWILIVAGVIILLIILVMPKKQDNLEGLKETEETFDYRKWTKTKEADAYYVAHHEIKGDGSKFREKLQENMALSDKELKSKAAKIKRRR